MDVLLHDGKPLKVQGFANVFGRTAETEYGTEIIRPGAFAASLKSGAQDIVATWAHQHFFTWARTADKTLELWETPTGLAFEAAIECSMRGRGLADFVAQGHAVASITLIPIDCVKTPVGKEVIRATLEEICIYSSAAYPTAVWLAGNAQPDTLTPRAEALRRRWLMDRQARQTVSAEPRATRVRCSQSAAVSHWEASGPPPAGMDMEQWIAFGQRCAPARRCMK